VQHPFVMRLSIMWFQKGAKLDIDFLVEVVRTRKSSLRRRIELLIFNAENLFRRDPRTVLNAAGLLMGEITAVYGQASSEESVFHTCSCNTVIDDVSEVRKNRGRVGDRR